MDRGEQCASTQTHLPAYAVGIIIRLTGVQVSPPLPILSEVIGQCWSLTTIQTVIEYSSITMSYDVYGDLFHDPAKDVDLMGEMERGLLAA